MKISALIAASLPFAMTALAAEKSGHADAELIAGVASYQPGKTVPVGIKLKIEPGWHSYWVNPGEGGMPMSAKWTLPAGWKAGELKAPVPKRFKTGDLPGFGYEGEAIYRVDLTPPASAKGEAELKVKLSWLTCNESACVPGDVELSVKLTVGDGAAGKDAAVLVEAEKKIPQVSDKSPSLFVLEREGGRLFLALSNTSNPDLDLTGVKVFPASKNVVDAADELTFSRIDFKNPVDIKETIGLGEESWFTFAKKSEYAEGPATLLDIVLAGGKLERPLIVSWREKK
ncbi:protein-disulfide reductase DsbD domain-containing protein [Luteolibacter soli]|uniref:Protein-disulfide reductase DsbD domain-containing protein n=1 Tax=Luteolibacter soli TaxID=3135280 RepID=A0ABU9AX98_9BACT